MSSQTVTVNIPEPPFQQTKARAERGNRTVDAELVSRSGTQPPWACLVEPQGQWEGSFLTRLLQYLLLLHDELRHGPHGQDRYLMMAGIVNVCEQPLQSALKWLPPGAPPGVGL